MLTTALLLLLSAEAKTASVPFVAVFVQGEDATAEHHAGKIEVELSHRLAKRGAPLVDLAARYPPPRHDATEGSTLIKEGKEAYDNLDMDAAIQKLTDAGLYFIKHPEAADPKLLAEVFVFLGAAELQNNKKAEAHKNFLRAVALDPTYQPDPKFFAADVQKAFSSAHHELAGKHKGTVIFESSPAGATLALDGREIGLTPHPPVELTPGRHHVLATRPGYVTAGKLPEVASGAHLDVKLELQPLPAYAGSVDLAKRVTNRNNFDAQVLPPQASQLGQELGARYLVLGKVVSSKGSNKVEVQVWDVQTGDRLRELKFDGDEFGLDKAAETITLWIGRPVAEVVVEAKPEGASGAFKKPWVWAVIGAVVVGTAVGVGVGIGAQQPRGFDIITGIP
ncbi:MAG: PEGA domain-containing protein [Myxococcaceae bacterium]|nr:PEGA domain-containing protein [Myxococcaceae bacterium]